MKKINYLITKENIIVNFNGNTLTINSTDSKKYLTVKKLIKEGDETSLIEFLQPSSKIIKYANEYFFVDDQGYLFFNDEKDVPLPSFLADKLIDFINEELDITPVVNFWLKLRENPTKESREDLYKFLTINKHPITEDGCFIAYKKVTLKGKTLVDSRTKKMDNSVGKKVNMPRSEVNADRSQSCSTGLHVASLSYAKTFTGDVLVEVLVDPINVVVVPTDYKSEKMRTCGYTVLNIVKLPTDGEPIIPKTEREKLLRKLPKTSDDITKKILKHTDIVVDEIDKELTINLGDMTAKEILAEVIKKTGEVITLSPSNKKGIIKKAILILESKGFIVN